MLWWKLEKEIYTKPFLHFEFKSEVSGGRYQGNIEYISIYTYIFVLVCVYVCRISNWNPRLFLINLGMKNIHSSKMWLAVICHRCVHISKRPWRRKFIKRFGISAKLKTILLELEELPAQFTMALLGSPHISSSHETLEITRAPP